MSSEEERLKHSRRRKKNIMAKELRDNKGPFAIKVIDPKKTEYRREKLRVTEISTHESEIEDEREYFDEQNSYGDLS